MLFPTIDFAIFFSIVFPVTWAYHCLLASISLFAFIVAMLLGRQRYRSIRIAMLWLGILGSIGFLIFFKYYNFLIANLMNSAITLGFAVELPFIELAIPVAISFVTFRALAYIIDVYNKRLLPSSSLIDVLLHLSFFRI
jgi:alginate O-acetyltransferase complex protein AlgI